jgi:GH25 family lysozyme M1 (1,4-beta-N-acetylmuramidase)
VKRLALFSVVLVCACSSDEIGTSESAVKVCGQTTVKGVDVYHLDNGAKPIDWPAVKSAGASFAFVKATESTGYTDSSFQTNWAGLKAAGMYRGAYHFFHSDVDPAAQATFFLSVVGKVEAGDMLVLDLESANGQTQATILSHALTFMQNVESATGTKPMLYTSPAFLTNYGGLAAYPLWVANYGVSCPDVPAAWKTYEFWQSSGTGSFPPITGAVDLDTFNGTLADLQTFTYGTPTTDAGIADTSPPPPPLDAAVATDAGSEAEPVTGCACSTLGFGESHDDKSAGWIAALVVIAAETSRRRRRAARERAR